MEDNVKKMYEAFVKAKKESKNRKEDETDKVDYSLPDGTVIEK